MASVSSFGHGGIGMPSALRRSPPERAERLVAERAELERGADGDVDADAGRDLVDTLVAARRAAPHLAAAGEEVPDLLDGTVAGRERGPPPTELEVRGGAALGPQEDADVAAVRRRDVGLGRERLCAELAWRVRFRWWRR